MTVRVFEAFAGVGSQRMALRNLGIDHEVVAIAEIDKFAIKSYEAIHGETINLGDISQIETADIPDHDLFTYSFPCQDISVAGQGLGLDEGSGTRSGLLWECQKVITGKKPKYLLLENVKNLVGKKHKHNFDRWLDWLEEQGYTNYWKVLNAKDYGVPQNRERVFVVSILGGHEPYEFPETVELELRLKDILESEVDEKFYLSDEKTKTLIANTPINESLNGLMEVGSLSHYKRNDINRVYSPQGNCPTLNTMQGGDRQPKVLIKNATKKGYLEAKGEFGRMGRQAVETLNENDVKHSDTINPFNKRVSSKDGISPTLTTRPEGFKTAVLPVVETLGTLAAHNSDKFGVGYMDDVSKTLKANKHDISVLYSNLRIRKLTPKECWRLMGFSDDDFHKAEKVNSNSQLYKQAGNSIVVDVLEGIFKQLLEVAEWND